VAGAFDFILKGGFPQMKKPDWQYLVDTLLFVCIIGIASIGILMGLVIPQGPQASEKAKYFLGLHRHQWGNIHFYLSIAFICLVVIHIVLSWSWIKGKARQLFKRGWGTVLILTGVMSLLSIFLFWAFTPRIPGAYEDYGIGAGRKAKREVFESPYPQEGRPEQKEIREMKEEQSLADPPEKEHEQKSARGLLAEDASGILISGQMTLFDIESKTGISAKRIADELNLPAGAPLNETLGRLRKRYLFTMQEVRDAVDSLMKKEKKENENNNE
jgi:hypothetical protein